MSLSTEEIIRRLEALEADNKRIHESRHELNERVFSVVDEERSFRMELEETVKELAKNAAVTQSQLQTQSALITKLCDAIRGDDMGNVGFIQTVKDIKESVAAQRRESREYREKNEARIIEIEKMLATGSAANAGAWKLATGVALLASLASALFSIFRK